MDGDKKDMEEPQDIVKDIWADFTSRLDAREIINEAYSRSIINRSTRDKMMKEDDRMEAARHFLIHLENSATTDTLWKVHAMLQKMSKDHDSHKYLCEVLRSRLRKRVSIIATLQSIQHIS